MFNWLRKKKGYVCGGEKTIEINDKVSGSKSTITYRIPNGDEMLSYVHAQIQDDESTLKDFVKKDVSTYDLHKSIRDKKFIPYAKKIIIKISGYYAKDGSEVQDIDSLVEFYPQHLELLCSVAYAVNEDFKKKD